MSGNKKGLISSSLLSLFLVLITFITYLNILPNQLFFDDEELIYKNAYIQDIRNLPKFFTENMIAGAGKVSNMYRPILLVSFALDYLIWKNNPLGYHLTSIFLHAANTVFIYILIKYLFEKFILAFFTSLFFAVHPAISEAVIYASGRTDPLYTFYLLISLILFLFVFNKNKFNFLFYLLSILFFIFSLLSKESAIMLPGILFITILFFHSKGISINHKSGLTKLVRRKNLISFIIPYILISLIYIYLRLTILNFENSLNFYQNQNIYSQSLLVRFYTFSGVFFQYLKLLVLPLELIVARKAQIITSPFHVHVILFILLIFFLLIFSIWQIKKRNYLYFFCFFWFFITISPVSGVIPINNIIAEHYLYLPSIAFFLFVSHVLVYLWNKSTASTKPVLAALFILIFGICSTRTFIRTFDWRDPITFYSISLAQSPENIPMRHNLAMSYAEKGDYDEAINSIIV